MRRTFFAGILPVFGLFALIYASSLTFVYIEGDDATSIAYHALGRNPDIQPPYSAYQSMMDSVLWLFPAREPVLRITAMLISAVAAPLLVLLMALLALDWAGDLIEIPLAAAALFVPLAAPELVYLGLLYTPALVAMAAAVGAHLAVRRALRRQKRGRWSPALWGAAALLGVGAACRWDVAAYGAVIAVDMWVGPGLEAWGRAGWRRALTALGWSSAAAAAWLATVALNGYGPLTIWKTLRGSGPVESLPGWRVMAATIQTFATPALILFAAVGFCVIARRRRRLLIPVLLGVALTARFLPFGVPKWFLVAAPGIVCCALAGLGTVWRQSGRNWAGAALRVASVAVLLLPWAAGVRTTIGDSAYGPGFQVREFDRPLAAGTGALRWAWAAGAMVPTSEGPRPIGGHAWVLLGGGWRKVARAFSTELREGVRCAAADGEPLLEDLGEGYVPATLAGMGFTTHDPWSHTIGGGFLKERRFVSAGGRQVRVLRLADRDSLFAADGVRRLRRLADSGRVVVFAYTSTLRRCYRLAPGALTPLGPTTAWLDLDKLQALMEPVKPINQGGR